MRSGCGVSRRPAGVLVVPVLAAALVLGGGRVAVAQGPGPVPVHLSEDEEGEDAWRRPLLWSALGLTGAGLLSAVYFRTRYNRHIRDFNSFRAPSSTPGLDGRCAVSLPNSGPIGCAHILAGANSAKNLATISVAVAGGAALTALILKVTEPEVFTAGAEAGNRQSSWALACSPLGVAGVSCGMLF